MVSEPESKKFGTEKSLGTGLEKIWYRKKVSESVSKKFGTEKSLGIGLEKIWYRKKVSEPVSFRFWVSSHTDMYHILPHHTFVEFGRFLVKVRHAPYSLLLLTSDTHKHTDIKSAFGILFIFNFFLWQHDHNL